MTSFALIAEGITDQVVLESILYGFYDEEPDVREIQPVRDATDESRQGEFGGWEKVLEYCGLDIFRESFLFNDYVIIQIDTDVCGHPNFDIPVVEEGKERSVFDLVMSVRAHIASKIGPVVYGEFCNKIIFAISVHSLECWLLPLHDKEHRAEARTKNCEYRLRTVLGKADVHYDKDFRTYQLLAKGYEKRKNIVYGRAKNASFDMFIESLPLQDEGTW